ncbi:hypothetical protein MMF93_20930 [Streptomyces tubbatahanensis]|uniref:Integral membrane protein n=1 Tax=Streptomyces tubbatahanensis TaxID=2923272 RepID=A0ABY3XWB1_9ACTN|nr:hypothetical protein [Streptomyces tubbatahanensis]UNS98649.1 hypothetical protein MMF93_20930 [Streptomyces tubbatahanensis]
MPVRRRAVAAVTALVLTLEAVVLVGLNLFLGKVADVQQMSLAGIEPRAMTISAVIGAVLVGGYVLTCALILARTAIRDLPPRGFWRIVLISCAVVHGVLGAFCVGLVGWTAFVVLMAVLGLIVWSLTWYGAGDDEHVERAPASRDAAAPAQGEVSAPPTGR